MKIDSFEYEQIAKIIKERVTHRKTPAKMVSHEEMMALVEKRLNKEGRSLSVILKKTKE